jgi:tRNA-intron endonuclease
MLKINLVLDCIDMSKKKGKEEELNNAAEVTEEEAWEEEEKGKHVTVEEEHPKEVVDAKLEGDKVIVWTGVDKVYEPGYYGKQIGERLELALVEACLLLKRGRIRVMKDNAALTFQELFDIAQSLDARFVNRYRVYEDLRERGLLVRTGFKFGCDFRVYERGVQLKKGPKSAREHTKWIVFSVPEDFTQSFQELSRAVRLAHNIRARMLWAVVDNEGDCTYYQITRHKP